MRILVISGLREAGKSLLCRRIAEYAKARSIACHGCIETSLRGKQGVPYQIRLVDIASGQVYLAAERPKDRIDVPFQFYLEAFARIRASYEEFMHAISASIRTSASEQFGQLHKKEICIIDEIGPLELERHLGHADFLKMVLYNRRCDVLILTVRPSLQTVLLAQLNENSAQDEVSIIDIDTQSRQAAQNAALSYIGLA